MTAVELSRRTLLQVGGLTAFGALGAGAASAVPRAPQTLELRGTAFGTANYQYHPFTVPAGTNRLDIRIVTQGDAKTGLGLFDQRGSHYGTPTPDHGRHAVRRTHRPRHL